MRQRSIVHIPIHILFPSWFSPERSRRVLLFILLTKKMMKNIAVIGLGKVGSLVATLLNDLFTVTGVDQHAPADLPFKIVTGDINNAKFLEELLSKQDGVVSCLPYNLNLPVAEAAFKTGIHYFDL